MQALSYARAGSIDEAIELANLCADRGIEPAYMGPADFEKFATQQAEYFAEQIPLLLGMRQ